MRLTHALAFGLPLAFCAVSSVRAQQAVVAPAPAPVVVGVPVQPALAPPDLPLAIPAPPGGKLRVEMDARSEDILGLMKSFLKGLGETGQPSMPTPAGQTPSDSDLITQILEGNNLTNMLKDVNHVHFEVWELPTPPEPPAPTLDPKAKGKFLPAVTPPPPVPPFDSSAFYETAFGQEGGRRLLYTDADAYKLVMVGFPNRRGFAFAASGAGYAVVSRSDGYPDLEVLSSFVSRITVAALKSKAGKGLIDSTMGGDKK